MLTQPRAVQRPDDVAAALVAGGHPPTRLAVEQEDLEEHFLRCLDAATRGGDRDRRLGRRLAASPGAARGTAQGAALHRAAAHGAGLRASPRWSAASSCTSSPTPSGRGAWASSARRRSSPAAARTGRPTSRSSRQAATVGGFVLFAFVDRLGLRPRVLGRHRALPAGAAHVAGGDHRRQVRRRGPVVRRAHRCSSRCWASSSAPSSGCPGWSADGRAARAGARLGRRRPHAAHRHARWRCSPASAAATWRRSASRC